MRRHGRGAPADRRVQQRPDLRQDARVPLAVLHLRLRLALLVLHVVLLRLWLAALALAHERRDGRVVRVVRRERLHAAVVGIVRVRAAMGMRRPAEPGGGECVEDLRDAVTSGPRLCGNWSGRGRECVRSKRPHLLQRLPGVRLERRQVLVSAVWQL